MPFAKRSRPLSGDTSTIPSTAQRACRKAGSSLGWWAVWAIAVSAMPGAGDAPAPAAASRTSRARRAEVVDHTIRVRLQADVSEAEVHVDGPFDLTDPETGEILSRQEQGAEGLRIVFQAV